MALATGARIGPYDVVDSLGAGGMGEVYRARDSRLGRDVALKVLPDVFAHDAERLARFEREAQVLAALNHPHIAAIYGLEEAGDIRALVLELVEGDTLAERLERGAMPFDEALQVARQIVAALEAAHEQGIIHRDLKPSNVKITPAGTVKVLDFGLAKLGEPAGGSSGGSARPMASQSPTITSPAMMTGAGLILGTAAYMAPEQAKGRPADRKSDVWAFGCVFYEMLTGKRAFEGEDVSETMAAVIRADPDWSRLPASTPPHVRTLLRRCLQKDTRKRLPDIGSARLELEEGRDEVAPALAPAAPVRPWWRVLPVAAAAIVAAAAGGLAVWSLVPAADRDATRLLVASVGGVKQFSNPNFPLLGYSRDGSRLAIAAGGQLFVKARNEFDARPVPGAQDPTGIAHPTFSPDGNQIAFGTGSDRMIKRIAVNGGVAVPVAPIPGLPLGMSWDADDTILYGQPEGIMKVRATGGGKPDLLVKAGDGETLYGPQMLPGNRVLFTLGKGPPTDRWAQVSIVAQSLSSGERQTIVEGGSDGRYLPTGHTVYAVSGTLFAVPVDPDRLTPVGPSVPVVQGVRRSMFQLTATPVAHFTFSSKGDLAYLPGPSEVAAAGRQLVIVEPSGARKALEIRPASYEAPRISPDETRVALAADGHVFVYELRTGTSRQLTITGRNRYPIWAGNERIAFQSDRDGDVGVFWQRADGSETAARLTTPQKGETHVPESWLPGADVLLYSQLDEQGMASLWAYSVTDKKATRVVKATSARQFNAEFSPDGRFIAYTLRGPGASIRVEPFPATGVEYLVSTKDAGHHPLWSREGRRLMYFPGANPLVSVDVSTSGVFDYGNPAKVAAGIFVNVTPEGARNLDIFKDGRFIMTDAIQADDGSLPTGTEIRFVLDWFEELTRLAPPER